MLVEVRSLKRSPRETSVHTGPAGPMVKASDYESGDSRFESWVGHQVITFYRPGTR